MNKKTFIALLLSFIGDQFYILFVSVILLKFDYTATFVAGALALTTLPNLIFGPMLGRWVDQSQKLKMHTWLCVILAIIVNLIGLVAYSIKPSMVSMVLIASLMIIYNLFYSPLSTLLYHYLIPNLDKDESKSFLSWEKYQAFGVFSASIGCYFLIKFNLDYLLLLLDGFSFLICAFIVLKNWIPQTEKSLNEQLNSKIENKNDSNHINIQNNSVHKKSNFSNRCILTFKSMLIEKANINLLFGSMLAMCCFIFSVDTSTLNSGILYFSQLKINIEYIPILISALSLFNILGAKIYEKYFIKIEAFVIHKYSLGIIALFLALIGLTLQFQIYLMTLLFLAILQMIEPIWSSTNTVLMRSQIAENKYGEFFGYFRIFRSLVTAASIYLYGFAQDRNMLHFFIYFGAGIVLFSFAYNKKKLNISI